MSIQIYCSNNTTRLLAPRLSPVEGDMGSSPFPHPTLPTLATAGAARRKPEQRGGRRRGHQLVPFLLLPQPLPLLPLLSSCWRTVGTAGGQIHAGDGWIHTDGGQICALLAFLAIPNSRLPLLQKGSQVPLARLRWPPAARCKVAGKVFAEVLQRHRGDVTEQRLARVHVNETMVVSLIAAKRRCVSYVVVAVLTVSGPSSQRQVRGVSYALTTSSWIVRLRLR